MQVRLSVSTRPPDRGLLLGGSAGAAAVRSDAVSRAALLDSCATDMSSGLSGSTRRLCRVAAGAMSVSAVTASPDGPGLGLGDVGVSPPSSPDVLAKRPARLKRDVRLLRTAFDRLKELWRVARYVERTAAAVSAGMASCRMLTALGTTIRSDFLLWGGGELVDPEEYSSIYSGVRMRPHLSFSRGVVWPTTPSATASRVSGRMANCPLRGSNDGERLSGRSGSGGLGYSTKRIKGMKQGALEVTPRHTQRV